MSSTKIIQKIDKNYFKERVDDYEIFVSDHALDVLSEGQRNVFKKEHLIKVLKSEMPILVGLQKNKRYAVFYNRKNYFLKLILSTKKKKIEIITFINTKTLPNTIKWK